MHSITTPASDQIDALFAEWDRPDSPGCALGIVRDGQLIYARGYGMADLEHDVPITPQSVFDIGSTAKQFTALCVALLERRGALSLDDEIQRFIPEMTRYPHPVTIRHLLHHTSGMRDYLTLMELAGLQTENDYPPEEILGLIARQKELTFPPGTEFLYSNSGYLLLGEIVRRAVGQSLREFAREHIFDPLGMQDTHFHDDFTALVKNRAIGYAPKEYGGFRLEMSIFDVVGDGGLFTTVENLARWDLNFYDNRIGGYGPDLIDQITTPGQIQDGERLDYAFGLYVENYRGLKAISHAGSWAGYRSELLRFPDHRFSVICLANLSSVNPALLARQVADLFLEEAYPEPEEPFPSSRRGQKRPAFIRLPLAELETRAAFYENEDTGNIWQLFVKDGGLHAEVSGLSFPVLPISPVTFIASGAPFDIRLTFLPPGAEGELGLSARVNSQTYRLRGIRPAALDPGSPAGYSGTYFCPELGVEYGIREENGSLLLVRKWESEEALTAIVPDWFKAKAISLKFYRDEAARVAGFLLNAGRVRHLRFERKEG